MDIKQEDVLLFFKIFIFAYIVISPFINNSWLKFINYTPIKIILLIIIVLLSFIDLQLAVLSMIAFLIILVNLNKEDIISMNKKATQEVKTSQELTQHIITSMEKPINKEQMIRGQSIFPMNSDILEVTNLGSTTGVAKLDNTVGIEKFQNENSNQEYQQQGYRRNYDDSDANELRDETNVRQTISNFPKPYCNIIEYDPVLISEGLSDYSLDYHTKPFEEYVKHLTPEMAKQIISNLQEE